MRAFLLAAAVAMTAAACYTTAPAPAYATRTDRWMAARTAYTTEGQMVTVQEDRHGVLRIVEPYDLRDRPVAVVNEDPDGDRPIVAIVDEGRAYRGSAGDVQRDYNR
ncbi:MAG TPA: hypothetical protein VLW85_06515 [Myxococcales bacterium]|nr:hypothetical protein [Myxococcales bacterium]